MSRANNDEADPSVRRRRQPVTARGEDKRRLILEAAADLLATNGYAATSLADIAGAVGTFAGSLYYHFESREALATEVLTGGIQSALHHNRSALEALGSEVSSRDRLGAALTAHASLVLGDNPASLAAFRSVGQLPPSVAEPVKAEYRRYLDHFAALFDDAAAEGQLNEAASLSAARMLLIGAAVSAADWFKPEGELSSEEVGRLLPVMLFDGLGAGSGTGSVS